MHPNPKRLVFLNMYLFYCVYVQQVQCMCNICIEINTGWVDDGMEWMVYAKDGFTMSLKYLFSQLYNFFFNNDGRPIMNESETVYVLYIFYLCLNS